MDAFDASVAMRMAFSCLVDADFRDTEAFYARLKGAEPDRVWLPMPDPLPPLLGDFDARIAQFAADSDLSRRRSTILTHVRAQAPLRPGLFTLTGPTGSGKTLEPFGFAVDHAATHGHRRIMYADPYTGAWIETILPSPKAAPKSEERQQSIQCCLPDESEAGAKCADQCRKHGMSECTFYARKAK